MEWTGQEGGVAILGGVLENNCGTQCHGLIDSIVLSHRLGSNSELFSNLTDSMSVNEDDISFKINLYN